MTSRKKHGIYIATVAVGFVLAICIIGCGSVPDGGFTPFTGSGYHPFGEDRQHGEYIRQNPDNLAECAECHGSDLHGVDNGVVVNGENDRSCYKCHQAEHHIIGFDDATQHPAYLTQHGWDLTDCYVCHANAGVNVGIDFGGSCRRPGCHIASSIGPQACNTCHGNSSGNPHDPASWAPPEDLAGNESGSNLASIGAHQAHVTMAGRNFKPVGCHVCHVQPASWNSPGHILNDNTPGMAEVALSFPATAKSSDAQYDRGSATCSSTYCHSGQTRVWIDRYWSFCTSCHGIPPGGTHYNWPGIEAQCYWCHGSVINAAGVIIAPQLHVDGYVSMN